MSQISYEAYAAQQKQRPNNNTQSSDRPTFHFLSEFLKNDGDQAIVRFPYTSMADVPIDIVHLVKDYPGAPYGRNVECTGGADCPICKAGNPSKARVLATGIVYTTNDQNQVELNAFIWDRPSAFADIDLKDKMENYGDLTKYLFKVKRHGKGTDTRYTMDPVMNATIYNPAVYKEDFSVLENLNAHKICVKTIDQYNAAKNGEPAPVAAPAKKPAEVVAPKVNTTVTAAKVPEVDTAPWEAPKAAPVVEERPAAPVAQAPVEERAPKRFSF